jgi:hypothetical protein
VEWECLVRAAQDTYEVCLEDLDCFLCNILPVVMWGYKLVLHVVEFDLFLEFGGTLVV